MGKCDAKQCVNINFTIISMALSFVTSLAFTSRWYTGTIRGTFIIIIAAINVSIRICQCCFNGSIAFWDSDKDAEDENTARMLVSFFIGLGTFSEATFDMLQGIILLYGVEYDNEVDIQ